MKKALLLTLSLSRSGSTLKGMDFI
uniref:Truncated proinflammatory outer membrane protein n=1 Tax=Helicobacter pylori TaxID=210 RepID=Q933P6_HELPX|nr:truncated proinflammatory outer membrane protein [Helicobacter pylori]AAL07801.1 truncated proinflammatory outer membrane protein [Helicobacter pylori]